MKFFLKRKINIGDTTYTAAIYRNGKFHKVGTYIYDLQGGTHINFYTSENLPLMTADGKIFNVYFKEE